MAEKICDGYVTFISVKTSILMNLLYFKIPSGHKNMTDNTGRQWQKKKTWEGQ